MRLWLAAIFCIGATAAVVDRVAVVIGKTVLTESEVQREVRLTAFLNQQPVDLSAAQRRAAAERLVDQELIRSEMKVSNFAEIAPAETDAILKKFVGQQYPNAAQYRATLEKYGISEEDLKQHLAWQTAAIRFTDSRFQFAMPPANDQDANRSQPGAEPPKTSGDQQLESWLKETRSQTRIQFKKEAFQ